MIENRADGPRQAKLGAWRAASPALSGCTTCRSQDAPARVIRRGALPQSIVAALQLAPSLTAREAAAFELLGLGYDNRSIAKALSISERTAKRYITAILAKLRLESRLQAGLAAMIMSLTMEPAGLPHEPARRGVADRRPVSSRSSPTHRQVQFPQLGGALPR